MSTTAPLELGVEKAEEGSQYSGLAFVAYHNNDFQSTTPPTTCAIIFQTTPSNYNHIVTTISPHSRPQPMDELLLERDSRVQRNIDIFPIVKAIV